MADFARVVLLVLSALAAAMGASLVVLNLRFGPIAWMSGRRTASPIPFLGSGLIVLGLCGVVVTHGASWWVLVPFAVLAGLDHGGLHMFLIAMAVTCPMELLSAVRRRGNPGDDPQDHA